MTNPANKEFALDTIESRLAHLESGFKEYLTELEQKIIVFIQNEERRRRGKQLSEWRYRWRASMGEMEGRSFDPAHTQTLSEGEIFAQKYGQAAADIVYDTVRAFLSI